jgi:hypothetical protein
MQEQNTNKGGVCRDCLAGFAFAAATRALSDLPVVDLCAAGRVVCEEGGANFDSFVRRPDASAALVAGTALVLSEEM